MIKCHLSTLMGQHKVKVADLAKELDIHRGSITRLYNETAIKIDIEHVDKLCKYFECEIGELFEFINEGKEDS